MLLYMQVVTSFVLVTFQGLRLRVTPLRGSRRSSAESIGGSFRCAAVRIPARMRHRVSPTGHKDTMNTEATSTQTNSPEMIQVVASMASDFALRAFKPFVSMVTKTSSPRDRCLEQLRTRHLAIGRPGRPPRPASAASPRGV